MASSKKNLTGWCYRDVLMLVIKMNVKKRYFEIIITNTNNNKNNYDSTIKIQEKWECNVELFSGSAIKCAIICAKCLKQVRPVVSSVLYSFVRNDLICMLQ